MIRKKAKHPTALLTFTDLAVTYAMDGIDNEVEADEELDDYVQRTEKQIDRITFIASLDVRKIEQPSGTLAFCMNEVWIETSK